MPPEVLLAIPLVMLLVSVSTVLVLLRRAA
jgi:hypothetical protein